MKWYNNIGQGMGDTLVFANETKGYTLSDRATWLSMAGKLPGLKLLPGGDRLADNKDKSLMNPYGVLPVNSTAFGKTLAEWSAEWWKLGIELPLDGNPFAEGGCFEVSGPVWALSGPLGTATLAHTMPDGKALFVPCLTIECSSLEPPESGFQGDTEEEQAACAMYWADHIVNPSIEIDGVAVQDLASYRVVSPQFAFTAPDPNILFVPGGGAGTAVADGYYLILAPLSKGGHTIRIRGALHFSVAEGDPFDLDLVNDVTIHLTVE